MSNFRNTKRLTWDDLADLIRYPISEGQTYFATDAGVFFKDIHGQRFATLEVDSLENIHENNLQLTGLDKLKGRILLINPKNSGLYEWFYVHPETGNLISLSESSKLSAGIYEEPVIDVSLYPGQDEFTVSACCVNLFSTPNHLGSIQRYSLQPRTWTPSDVDWPSEINKTYYVIADYNSGLPELKIIDSVVSINESDIIPVFTIVRTPSNIHYIVWDQLGAGLPNKLHARFVKTSRFAKESGLSLSGSYVASGGSYTWNNNGTITTFNGGGVKLNLSGGVVWNGAARTILEPVDTLTDKIRFYYHTDTGDWDYSPTDSIINRRQYDEIDNGIYTGLENIGATARYAVAWIFRGILHDKYLGYILSNQYYSSKADALSAEIPLVLPDIFRTLSMLVGKVVFSYNSGGTNSDFEIINITTGTSGGSGSSMGSISHNDLSGRDQANAHPMESITPGGTYEVLSIRNRLISGSYFDEPLLSINSRLTSPATNLQEWKVNGTLKSAITKDGYFTGKSASADKLFTSRTINGVNFDGTANITIKSSITQESSSTNFPITFVNNNTEGFKDIHVAAVNTVSINPATGAINATVFNGSLSGNASSANQIKVIKNDGNASFYLTFVDSNNTTSTNENIYSNSNVTYNPGLNTGTLSVPHLIATSITATDFNIVHAEDVYTSKDHIILRDGAVSALAAGQYTGVIAKIPDGTNDAALVFDGNGMARVGDISYDGTDIVYDDTQALATRVDTPTANSLFFWDATAKRLDSTAVLWSGTGIDGVYTISIDGVRKDALWDTAYTERGSQIGGTNLTWNGTQLDVDILDFNDVDFADQNLLTTSSPTFIGLIVNDKIGIGTTDPSETLHVNGTILVEGQLTVDSIMRIGNLIIEDTAPADVNSGYIEIRFVS